jgi:hypothetical protein
MTEECHLYTNRKSEKASKKEREMRSFGELEHCSDGTAGDHYNFFHENYLLSWTAVRKKSSMVSESSCMYSVTDRRE